MPTKIVELYEIKIKMTIRRDYWHNDNESMNKDIIKDKVQQGIEVPIEDIDIQIER